MSVVNVHRNKAADTAGSGAERRWTLLAWTVLVDDAVNDDVNTAKYATGIPRIDEVLTADPWQAGVNVDARCRGGGLLYDVAVRYESGAGGDLDDNPIAEPMEIEWFSVKSREAIENDIHGDPIHNSAGESFDPPLEEDVYDTGLRISRNTAAFDDQEAAAYRGAVNADAFRGYAPGQCRIAEWTAVKQYAGHFVYWKESIEIHIRQAAPGVNGADADPARAWYRRLLDKGFMELLVDETGAAILDADGRVQFKKIKDAFSSPITQPVGLDGAGRRLAADAAPFWWEYETKPSKEFGPLGLDADI